MTKEEFYIYLAIFIAGLAVGVYGEKWSNSRNDDPRPSMNPLIMVPITLSILEFRLLARKIPQRWLLIVREEIQRIAKCAGGKS